MSRYILALDQGTTSSRAILFDRSGNIIQMAQQEFTQHYPQPGWVEHNPNELFDSQAVVAAKCLRQAGITGSEVAAVGIANQRETTVVWNRRTGAPVYNAIVWQDRRTAGFCDSLREQGKAGLFAEKTGLVLDAYFSGTKVRWVLENVPGAREQAEAGDLLFGTVDSWLIWNFTKGAVHATDPSNASRSISTPGTGTTNCLSCFPCRVPCCRRWSPHPGSWGTCIQNSLATAFLWRATPGISRPRPTAMPVCFRAWRRTPTGPGASFS